MKQGSDHYKLRRVLILRDVRNEEGGIIATLLILAYLATCPSVTLRYRGYTGWVTSKVITRIIISIESSLVGAQRSAV